MSIAACPVKEFDELIKGIQARFAKPNVKKRITFILGAGVSMALVQDDDKRREASWSGLLTLLFKNIAPYFEQCIEAGDPDEKDARRTLQELRQRNIEALAKGGADMTVAMTYLIDRLHRLFESKGWRHDVNELTCLLEDEGRKPSVWSPIFARMGDFAREGKALLATTNFDHTIASLAGLPIYLMPQNNSSFSGTRGVSGYVSWPEGLIIPVSELDKREPMTPDEVEAQMWGTLPAPASYLRAWKRPDSLEPRWFRDLASVLHVHGSRRVPPSLVFDPMSYDAVETNSTVVNLLRGLVDHPERAGAIVFIGCENTLFDPHFVQYWRTKTPSQHIYCLVRDQEAKTLRQNFQVPYLKHAPQIISYGDDFKNLPSCLNKLLDILD